MNGLSFSTLLIHSGPKGGANMPWMNFLPIGLGYIQAMLRGRGLPCLLANMSGMTKKKIEEYIRRAKPALVGISMFTYNRQRCFEIAKAIKKASPKTILLAGGPHSSHLPGEVFECCPELDAIVFGEGEAPMLEIARRLAQGGSWKESPSLIFKDGTRTAQAEPIADLDSIGFPAEHFEALFFDDINQLSYLSTSRGCPSKCTFCNTPEFWGNRVRYRSPDSVMREIKALWGGYGLSYFNFRDDTFTTDKPRVMSLCEKIKTSGIYPLWSCQSRANLLDEERLVAMVRAGCDFIQIGVEHGSERMLKTLSKGIGLEQMHNALSTVRKVGMGLGIYLITGIPDETLDDVAQSEKLIERHLPHDVQISPLAVYPGTRLYSDLVAKGDLPQDYYRKSADLEVFARKTDKPILAKVNENSSIMTLANAILMGNEIVYVDEHTAIALKRLRRATDAIKQRARYTPDDFRQQKKFLGWCATTNIMCGEAAEDTGNMEEAKKQYSEIIKNEPQNPWGWLKRGILNHSVGNHEAGDADFKEVGKLMPNSYEASAALEQLAYSRKRRKK
jgi:radical SAM superfamily enzyme YgiQ (UPF0313 family)